MHCNAPASKHPALAAPTSIIAAPYRAVMFGTVALEALTAFEALAVATVMPAATRELMGCACTQWRLAACWQSASSA